MIDRLRVARRSLAETTAANVLRQSQVTGLWVDPLAIAANKNIMVEAKPDAADGEIIGLLLIWISGNKTSVRRVKALG